MQTTVKAHNFKVTVTDSVLKSATRKSLSLILTPENEVYFELHAYTPRGYHDATYTSIPQSVMAFSIAAEHSDAVNLVQNLVREDALNPSVIAIAVEWNAIRDAILSLI